MKLKTIIAKLNEKDTHQLYEYCNHNMKLKKADLIDLLENAGEKVDRKQKYIDIVKNHRECIIDIIFELWENCD